MFTTVARLPSTLPARDMRATSARSRRAASTRVECRPELGKPCVSGRPPVKGVAAVCSAPCASGKPDPSPGHAPRRRRPRKALAAWHVFRFGQNRDPMWHDLKLAVRSIRARPGFAAVVIATLALGIGANTAIFSVVDAVVLRPPPYRDPESLFYISRQILRMAAKTGSPAWRRSRSSEAQVHRSATRRGHPDI